MGRLRRESAREEVGAASGRLLRHHVLAVLLATGLMAGGGVLQRHTLAEGERARAMAVRAEGQRMAAEGIVQLAAAYLAHGAVADRERLAVLASGFGETQRALSGYAGGIAPEADRAAADARALRVVALAGAIGEAAPGSAGGAAAMRALVALGRTGVPADLDADAALFAARAEAADRAAGRMLWAFPALVAALLSLGAGLVFRPMLRRLIDDLVGTLESDNDAILKRNSELEDRARNLSFSAAHDPLTGLGNRKKLQEHLTGILEGAGDLRLCVLHIDLDHFKELNDSLGHATGDAALKHVAGIMKSRVRRDDMVARVGGDEFVIAMAGTGPQNETTVRNICEELIRQIREPVVVSGADIRLGASIGYAFAGETARDADTLIANADLALYEAKRAGKGVARGFTDGMQDRLSQRNAMILDMERALDEGEFLPYFQPLVALGTGEVRGIEMLARWAHPTRGLIHPSDFMEVAEEIGTVDAIEARILLDGLDVLARMRREGRAIPQLSLNASMRSMRYDDFAERLTEAVRAQGFAPSDIIVEVLETTFVTDARDQVARTVSKLRGRGFSVFVDEFGTGYSSLQDLASLDVNGLKIDRSLIADLEAPRARQVVQAIIGLARAMSLTVVAGGMASPGHAARLEALGADLAQGQGIAPPMPAGELASWLGRYCRAAAGAGAAAAE